MAWELQWVFAGLTGSLFSEERTMDTPEMLLPVIAAAEYSLIYLLAGGGVVGAIVIYIVAKMLGR
jgi:hypothetical protein